MPLARTTIGSLFIAAVLTSGQASAQSPSTRLTEVYNAHQVFRLKRWMNDYITHRGDAPSSVQTLLRDVPESAGIGWLWLVDRRQTPDFQFQLDFVTGGWAIAARPKRPDSNLSLYHSSEPQAVIQGGDAGGKLGNSALPPLDMKRLEKPLVDLLDGPGDLEALLNGLAVFDAQTVLILKNVGAACNFEELDKAKAADHRLIDDDLSKGDRYFTYALEGVKDADGHCSAWVFRAVNRIEAFPTYELGSDRAVYVLATWGPRKGLRIPLDEWKPTPR